MLFLSYGTRRDLNGLAVRRLDAAENHGMDAQREGSSRLLAPGGISRSLRYSANASKFPHRRYSVVAGITPLSHSAEIYALIS
jgi:hypothetical protein